MAWKYRQSIELSSATTLTSYQVKFTISYSSGTSGSGTLYTNGHCNANFSDIRFKNAAGTSLPYCIESYTASTTATVWVKVDSISTTTIYFYYGNTEATSESSSANTFIFFDDFSAGTLDASKWNTSSGASISAGQLLLSTSTSSTHAYAISLNTISAPYKIISRCRTTFRGSTYIAYGYHLNMSTNTAIVGGGSNGYRVNESDTATHGANIQLYNGSWTTVNQATYASSNEIYYKAIAYMLSSGSNNVKISFLSDDYTTTHVTAQGSNTTYTSGYFTLLTYNGAGTTTAQYDYVFVTNYAATEPTYGTCSAEQLVSSGYSFGVIIW